MLDSKSDKIKRIEVVKDINKESAISRLNHIARLPGVQSVVALGDLGNPRIETPGSIGVATKGVIYPQFCSNVVNCGMSLFKTEWSVKDLSEGLLEEFLGKMVNGLKNSTLKISTKEFVNICLHGAGTIVKKHNLPEQINDRIENDGSMFDNPESVSLYESVPRWFSLLPSHRKIYFPDLGGNHFIEIQSVRELVDEKQARKWGLEEDQIIIMLHTDSRFTSRVNWQYLPRAKMKNLNLFEKAMYFSGKAAFQFMNMEGLSRFIERKKLYFDNDRLFKPITTQSFEGERMINALRASMNYGYTARVAFFIYLRDIISNLSKNPSDLELIWDVSHDSIQEETINGEKLWVARKAASKVVPGKPAIIAGDCNIDSCLAVGLKGGEEYLNSYDHGIANIVTGLERTERLDYRDGFTLKYRLGRKQGWNQVSKENVKHKDSLPIKLLMDSLSKNNLVKPVAWLKPMANLKVK